MLVLLRISYSAYAQSDSVRVEISEEAVPTTRTQPHSARDFTEKKRLNELYRRSRKETTLFELGFEQPVPSGGILLFNDHRPPIEKTRLYSLWGGIEQKLSPAWSALGGVGWQYAPATNQAGLSGTSWMGQLGINYYPLILKAMRNGKSADNFYRQAYVSARALLPFHDRLSVNTTNPVQTITANPFQQAAFVGIGTHSTRTRLYYYNFIVGAAYLFGRDEGINHSIQLMMRISFGIGL